MRLVLIVVFLSGFFAAAAQLPDTMQKVIPGRTNSARQEKGPYVIYISADGFRYDLADKYHSTYIR